MIIRKFYSGIFLLSLLLLICPPQAGWSSSEPQKIKVTAVGAYYFPFLFEDSEKNLAGFDVDLLRAIESLTNLEFEIKILPFKEVIETLRKGEADIGLGAIYLTPEREKIMRFTTPYLKTGLVYLHRPGDPVEPSRLEGKTIGVKKGATGEKLALSLAGENARAKVASFSSTEESIDALIRGDVDLVFNDYLNSVALLYSRYPGKYVIGRGVFGVRFLTRDEIAFPVSNMNPELLTTVNSALKKLIQGGMVSHLYQKWFHEPPPLDYEKITLYGIGFLVILAALSLSILRYSRIKYRAKVLEETLEEKERVAAELRKVGEMKKAISNIFEAYIRHHSHGDSLQAVLQTLTEVPELGVEAKGAIFSLDNEGKNLIMKTHLNMAPGALLSCKQLPIGRCLCGRVAETGRPIFESAITEKHEITYPGMEPHGHYIFPLRSGKEITGVLTLYVPPGEPHRGETEEFLQVISSAIGIILEREKAEGNINRLLEAIENVEEGIVLLNGEKKILYANPPYCRMTRTSLQDLQGEPWSLNFTILDEFLSEEDPWKVVQEGRTWYGEVLLMTRSGEEIYADLSISSIRDRSGNITDYIVIVRDITEQVHLERELQQAQKMEMLGRVAGKIAHEINNNLAGIAGYCEILRMRASSPEDAEKLARVLSLVEKSSRLIGEILSYTKKSPAFPQKLNPHEVIEETIESFKKETSERIHIIYSPGEDVGIIEIDRKDLEKIISALLKNAREAILEEGTIEITTLRVSKEEKRRFWEKPTVREYFSLSVRDTGEGIPLEIREKIFEPFFTTKKEKGARGLGLSVVYGIVSRYGGHVEVKSKPGSGSIFTVYLPASG